MGKIVLKLDSLMKERGISLYDLAAQVGISHVNLSKIKNNHVTAIRFSTLAGICETLECQPGDLLVYEADADDEADVVDDASDGAEDGAEDGADGVEAS